MTDAMIDTTAREADPPVPEPEQEPPDLEAEPIAVEVLPARAGAVGSALADLPVIPAMSEMTAIAQLATTLAAAGACPSAIRGKPNDVFLVLLSARDLGVSLTTAMREFHVIDGKVTLSPKVKLALVRQSGLGRIWPDADNTAEKATWYAERHDLPGQRIASTFTWADAQLAHLTDSRCTPHDHWKKDDRAAGRNSADCLCKSNWKTYPARMVSWRAAGYLLDDVFPEVGTGLYSPDELGAVTDADGEPIEVRAVDPLPGLKGSGSRAAAAAPPAPMDEDVRADLAQRADRVRAHEQAAADLKAWWKERDLPPLRMLTAAQGRILEAKLAQVEAAYDLPTPTKSTPEADAEEGAGAPQEPEAASESPGDPGTAQGGPDAPIPADHGQPAAEPGDGGGPKSPPDGDVASWLIDRASLMNSASIKTAFTVAGQDPPKGTVSELRQAWALWQFEAIGRAFVVALSGQVVDPASIETPFPAAEQG